MRIKSEISIELDGLTLVMRCDVNAGKDAGIHDVGTVLGGRINREVDKLLGVNLDKARADGLQTELDETKAKIDALRKQMEAEYVSDAVRKRGMKRSAANA